MPYDETLAARVRTMLAGSDGYSERKMFGGIAFMLHGNMCCGIVRDELMVRVGAERYEAALARKHARPMDFNGRPMRGWSTWRRRASAAAPSSRPGWTSRPRTPGACLRRRRRAGRPVDRRLPQDIACIHHTGEARHE